MPRGPNVECLAVREICSIVHDVDADEQGQREAAHGIDRYSPT